MFVGCGKPAQSESVIGKTSETNENIDNEIKENTANNAVDKERQLESADQESDKKTTKESVVISKEPSALNAEIKGNFIADGVISDDEYSSYKNIDGFELYWANDTENIFIAMKAQTEGFVALGIQPGRKMKDADIILGFVDSISVSIYDMYSTGNFGPHPPDVELGGTDDILDFDGSEQNGYTIIEFLRLLSTKDNYDNEILPGINKIIWASGNADDIDMSHSKRGYGEIEIK